ncbi:MAG: Tim44 domain-containing protein [Alphaproteobacteria bacterium]|nr:Tim44 domain-containing protein [Alphaproteobacteria bacterium]
MGDGLAFFDIVFFALVAGFLILRLRSVLGRRTGNENRERWTPRLPPRAGSKPGTPADRPLPDNVTPLPCREPASMDGSPLGAAFTQIRLADPAFDPQRFSEGAKAAFEMIVTAFAQGDTASLRPLLADDVYENFAAAIKGRQDAKQTLETTLIGIKSAEIIEARMEGRTAYVTVKFISEQVNVTRNAAGEVVDGDANRVAAVTDIWTFARNTRASDPNWALVQTSESQ